MPAFRDVEIWASDGSDESWGDPVWEVGLRTRIEAECRADNPEHQPLDDDEWESLLKVFGV